jgi:hypothetical protein
MRQTPRLHAPVSRTTAANFENDTLFAQRIATAEVSDTAAAKPLRLRIDVDDFSRPMPVEVEAKTTAGLPAGRVVTTNGVNSINANSNASENPLRADYANSAIVPATAMTNGGDTAAYSDNSARYSRAQTVYQR